MTLNDVYTGAMTVYDSLLMFSAESDEHHLHIFNLNTGDKIGEFCPVGRGPGEFMNFTNTEQFVVDTNLEFGVSDRERVEKLLNITALLKTGKEQYDFIMRIVSKKVSLFPFSFVFMLDHNKFLAKTQCQELYKEDREYLPGSYSIYQGGTSDEIRKFIIYNSPVVNKIESIYPATFFNSRDRIKPK